MNIMIWMLILASILLGVLVFLSPNRTSKKQGVPEDDPQNRPSEDSKKMLISTLEEQLFSAKDELEKTKAESVNLQAELDNVRQRELDLREELMRQKDWYDKKVTELDTLKNEYLPLKNKVDKEIIEGLNLNKEIKEKNEAIELLKQKNKEMAEEIQALKAQIK